MGDRDHGSRRIRIYINYPLLTLKFELAFDVHPQISRTIAVLPNHRCAAEDDYELEIHQGRELNGDRGSKLQRRAASCHRLSI